ncbi:MAG: hypothetical protein ACP5QO_01040 [Clostridia bacterium]
MSCRSRRHLLAAMAGHALHGDLSVLPVRNGINVIEAMRTCELNAELTDLVGGQVNLADS